MDRVQDILADKPSAVHAVPPESTVHQAIERMVRHNVGCLLVLHDDRVVGIFTERDHLRRVTLPHKDPRTTPVADVMTARVIVVDPHRTIDECMSIMTRERIRHLPVVLDGVPTGMISIGDLVKHVSQRQQGEIRSLTAYITGP
jgi:CBS domain-containing protein